MVGLSKEDAERAHRSGRFDMGADEGPSDSGSSTEKSIKRGAVALLPGCGDRFELPSARGSAAKA